jgi:hypothetical protein
MTSDEFKALQGQLFTLAAIVRYMPIEAFLSRITKAEVLGPVLNPTLYREAAANMATVKRMAEALRAFQRSLPSLGLPFPGEADTEPDLERTDESEG